jgi:membrane protein
VNTRELARSNRTRLTEPTLDHGRQANHPSEIPIAGWKDIVARVWKGVQEDRIAVIAGGVTFYSVLALFPALAAMVTLFGLFTDPAALSNLGGLSTILPSGAIEVIANESGHANAQHWQGRLSTAGSLLIAVWSSNAGVKAAIDALNIVYNEKERRGILRLNAVSLGFAVAGLFLLAFTLMTLVLIPIAADGELSPIFGDGRANQAAAVSG